MLLWEAHTSKPSFLIEKKNQTTPLHPWKMPKLEQKEKWLVRLPPWQSQGLSGEGWYPLCTGAVLVSEGGLALPAKGLPGERAVCPAQCMLADSAEASSQLLPS